MNSRISLSFSLITLAALLVTPLGATYAQTGLQVKASTRVTCDTAAFDVSVAEGSGVSDLVIDFGDGETQPASGISSFPFSVDHTYPAGGDYDWSVLAADSSDAELTGSASGTLSIGPSVLLTSDPFPPLLTLQSGSAAMSFTAEASGGQPPYTYAWDLDGNGSPDAGTDSGLSTASFTYTSPGKYQASVTVTDSCGLKATGTLAVVVFDPEQACHPMAQRIAQAVDTLFPGQATQLYTCEQIFGYFQGDLTGSQLGFGRMWHAYQLATTIPDMTWEDILNWHLQGSGWGKLVQLNKLSQALADIGTGDLVNMVLGGEASVNDIRTAVRAVIRYDADFSDALTRLAGGANPGEINQFYRLAQELNLDAPALDSYLGQGMSLSQVRSASRLAKRFGMNLASAASAFESGHSWGEIAQAYRMANAETSAQEILDMGVKSYRQSQHETDRLARQQAQDSRTAQRLAERYGMTTGTVQTMLEACQGDWGCVRAQLRAQNSGNAQLTQDQKTAERLAAQFGVTTDQVWSVFTGECGGDWNCVRDHFRSLNSPSNGKGKDK
jgi:hypothetical protein